MENKTYSEDGRYYAVIWFWCVSQSDIDKYQKRHTRQSYYMGGFNSRSAARRAAIKRQAVTTTQYA